MLQLPAELQDMIHLHSAFLSAISLYYAHNGASSSIEVHNLLPMITKTWKKRVVTLDDVRRLLAFGKDATFTLQDFGRAGVCLTTSQPRGRATKRATSFVDEIGLSTGFEDDLWASWAEWQASHSTTSGAASDFISGLPLAGIEADKCVERTAPLFARGQHRLAELKAGQAAAKREQAPPAEPTTEQKSSQALQSRGTKLLDRILAKQALSASLPAGPTQEQLERAAALQRIEDIARALDLQAAGRSRCSFGMQAMVQQLQQSLRNPISGEEVRRCLGLMAREITPDFVSLVQSGDSTAVVIKRGGRVDPGEIRRRVADACS